uniref:Uncharacterized protein n=1 Tax=Anguilla anguilla TaxID=7936 RepID=A0A0E9XHK6_ANGAN
MTVFSIFLFRSFTSAKTDSTDSFKFSIPACKPSALSLIATVSFVMML